MKTFTNTTKFHIEGPCAVTLGKFDGIHRGHMRLMNRILEWKKAHPYDDPPGRSNVSLDAASEDGEGVDDDPAHSGVDRFGEFGVIGIRFVGLGELGAR